MSNPTKKISPNLAIPGFEVKVENEYSCKVTSKDGRHEFSANIVAGRIKITGGMFPKPLEGFVGVWRWDNEYTTDPDDVITHLANLLRLMDKLVSEGFSAKIDKTTLVLSHPSKPDYSLCMWLTDVRRFVSSPATAVYTPIKYCGPAYDEVWTKWGRKGQTASNIRLAVTNQDFDKLSQEIKTRILNLGERDPRITQWVAEELEPKLVPQGFTFTPSPEKGIVEFSHPAGVSGSLSFSLFTVGYHLDTNQKYQSLHFPTDLEKGKAVLFTCYSPNIRNPYTMSWPANAPDKAIRDIQGFTACAIVHQEVCKAWKSDILIPKLKANGLELVNRKLKGNKSIILKLTPEKYRLRLTGIGEDGYYPISNTTTVVDANEITQVIVKRADQYVQEFLQKTGGNRPKKVVEIDF
jgi:hypothetical protein